VDAFPDLTTLSDDQLRELIRDLDRQENEISYKRRILHGQIGLLRAELVARYQKSGESSLQVDVNKLTEILAGKGPAAPPDEAA
jgi:anti-sigma-K factor RsiG